MSPRMRFVFAMVLWAWPVPGLAEGLQTAEVDGVFGAPLRGTALEQAATGAAAALADLRGLTRDVGRPPLGEPGGARSPANASADIGVAPVFDFFTPNITIRGDGF